MYPFCRWDGDGTYAVTQHRHRGCIFIEHECPRSADGVADTRGVRDCAGDITGQCDDRQGQCQTAKGWSNNGVVCIFHTLGCCYCCATEREPYLELCSFALG